MITAGSWLFRWLWLLIIVPFVGMFFLKRRLTNDADFRVWWDRKLFGLPFIGKGYTLLVNQRFAKTMSILLDGGISIVDSLSLSGRATGSAWVEKLTGEGTEEVRHGASLSTVLGKIPPLSDTLPEWVRIGEASGGLGRLLSDAGERYRYRWEQYVDRCLSMFEIAVIIAVGGFVLLIVLSILLPIFSLTKVIGR
jgi:type II secretory pathway component PulF